MNPFRNILRLSVGDFVAKTLYFLAFVYLARVLGVANYGVLEFALSILSYLLLLADGGLELWATREAARGTDMRQLVARIVPLRFLLATGAFGMLLVLLPVFPDYPALQTILVLFGLTLLAQAANLKWVFMGREQMACGGRTGGGADRVRSSGVWLRARPGGSRVGAGVAIGRRPGYGGLFLAALCGHARGEAGLHTARRGQCTAASANDGRLAGTGAHEL